VSDSPSSMATSKTGNELLPMVYGGLRKAGSPIH
jgi:hypothetical protein